MKRQITTVLSIIILLAAFLGSASLAGIIPVARAATITVQSTADGAANAANCPGVNCRLRDAIAKATSGDAIDFDATVFSTERTITMTTDEIMIDKTLTIDASAVARVTISGSGVRRIFNLDHNSVTLTLKNLTLTNGRCYVQGCDGGAIYTYQGTVNQIEQCDDFLQQGGMAWRRDLRRRVRDHQRDGHDLQPQHRRFRRRDLQHGHKHRGNADHLDSLQ